MLNEGNLKKEIIKLQRLFHRESNQKKRKTYYKNFIYIIQNKKKIENEQNNMI